MSPRDFAEPLALHVNRVGFVGGVERIILTLSDKTMARGYRAMLACPGGGTLEAAARAMGIPVAPVGIDMRLPANPLKLASLPLRWLRGRAELLRLCRERRVDVIHAHHPVGVLYARGAARVLGLPLVFHLHEIAPARTPYAVALRAAVASADRIVCGSEASRRLLHATVPVDRSRVDVVHNGVDPLFVARAATAAPADLTEPGPHIGAFGVLEPRRGQDVFLSAAAKVIERYPGAKFWIVGPAAIDAAAWFAEHLWDIAEAPPLRGAVRFTGFRPDIPELMKAMDVIVLPSVEMEAVSMTLLEALTLGCRAIGTDVGGTAEVIQSGQTGLVVPPRDPGALAAAIERMLGPEGPSLARAAGQNARLRFRPETFSRHVAEVYAKAFERGPAREAA